MFNRNNKQPEPKKRRDLSQYGIFDVGMDDPDMDDDLGAGDSDLEAELAAITSGGGKSRPKAKKPAAAVPQHELDRMVADSLRDIGSDEELSGDDDDPDLLNELSELTGEDASQEDKTATQSPANDPPADNAAPPAQEIFLPTTAIDTAELIRSRISMYKLAESNAEETNDTSKARRFGRGLKTLEGLLKQAEAGKAVNNDDIPPEVFVKPAQSQSDDAQNQPLANSATPPAESPEASSSPSKQSPSAHLTTSSTPDSTSTPVAAASSVDEAKINTLLSRQREYKIAALTKKKEGDTATALQYVKIIKMFDAVLTLARQGQEVDLSDMPPPPSELPIEAMPAPQTPGKSEGEVQQAAELPKKAPEAPPPAPTSILDALEQRLAKYRVVEQEAKDEGNSSKARRFGRIVKQYEDAIKLYKAKKPVPFDELPTPPGFGPIPVPGASAAPAPAPPAASSASVTPSKPAPEKTSPPARPPLNKQESRVSGNHSNTSVMSKTIETLLQRQQEFKAAALAAKKAGEIEQAKEYLKTFKGIDNLLNVARGGLPVDLSTLPISPNQRDTLENTFADIDDDAPEETSGEELHDVYGRLEEQLQKQLNICKTTRDHHKALGDVAGMNRFENLALGVQKDLDLVKYAKRKKTTVPKFHYEQKSFNIVKCNTDLAETELEINVVRGVSFNVSNPKEIDTYVKFEFGFPSETPYKTKTQVIYNTENPEYNEKFIAPINPKARLCQRVFKRGSIKFEVYAKGGFFRSDTLLGVATVKLQQLETTCEIHDSFDLMDGRKVVGGKVEVKLRLRNPILTKQVEQLTEKWLIFGS